MHHLKQDYLISMKHFKLKFAVFIITFIIGSTTCYRSYYDFNMLSGHPENSLLRLYGQSEEELYFFNKAVTSILTNQDFNGNIYISKNGITLYDRSIGFSDYKTSQALNKTTVFQLASISKTFTATAILLLQEDSLLSINDSVVKHIPEFPYEDITIKHLLTHTSGLQNYMYLLENFWTGSEFPDNEDVLEFYIRQNRSLNFNPGSKFQYSNTGYVFLALIVERVSGKPFPDFLNERIFSPLGLNNTFVYDPRKTDTITNRAYGYRKSGNNWLIIPDDMLDAVFGDKGVYSNIPDLQKWDYTLYSDTLIPDEKKKEAFSFARLDNDSLIDYGYGWRLQEFLDYKVIHHPGRWHGFRTSFKRYTDNRAVLIILSNNDTDIADLVDTLQNLMFKEEREVWMSKQNKHLEGFD